MKRRALVLTVLATALLLLPGLAAPGAAQAAALDIVSLASSAVENGNGWSNDANITFTYAAEDPGSVSGYSWAISSSPGVDPDEEQDTVLSQITRPGVEGHLYFAVKATDGAGNWGAKDTIELRNDSVAPAISALSFNADGGGVQVYYNTQITVGWITLAADETSPIDTEELNVDAGGWSTTLVVPAPANHSNDGDHTARMRVTDEAGNAGLSPVRDFAIDTTPPVTNQTGGGSAWHSANVTVTFDRSDAVSGVDYTQYRLDGGGWSNGLSVNVTTDGSHTVDYRSMDNAGNLEDYGTTLAKVDKTPPVTTQTGGGSTWRTANVTVTFDANDAASGVDATQYRIGENPWTAGASVTVSTSGTHTVDYRSTDVAGNIETFGSTTVKIDKTVPSTTLAPQDGQWHSAGDYAFSADDTFSGLDPGVGYGGIRVTRGAQPVALVQDGVGSDWHLPASFPEGSSSIQYWATDLAGNVEPAASAAIDVDETPPVSSVSGADALWHADPVQLTFIAFDAGSGVATQESRIDGGPWVEGATRTVGAPASHANDGVRVIDFRAIDVAGNVEQFKSVEVKIDTTAPVTTRTGGGAAWSTAPAVVQFDATDGQAGVSYTEYRLDGGGWVTGGSVSVSAEGEHSVDFRSVDNAGNTEEFKTVAVKVDGTPPVTSDDTDGLWHAGAVPVTLTPSDALSGVAQTEYRIDGGDWQVGTTFNVTGAGQHTVGYRSTDNAGNVEEVATATVRIDNVPPVTTQSGADDLWHKVPVTISFDAGDDVSGVATTEYRVDEGEWTGGTEVTVSGEGVHALRYRSTDVAGNQEANNLVEVKIDATPPTTTEDAPAGWIRDTLLVRLTPTDATSGMSGGSAATHYSTDAGGTWKLGRRLLFAVDAAGHTTDGEHAVLYRSTDAAGNGEEAKTFTIRVDTRKPTPAAPSKASVRRMRTATLKYSVADLLPCNPTAKVTIKIKTLAGRTVKTLRYARKAVNTPLTARFVCKLRKRTYKFVVYATDAAGNTQSKVARNTLVVR